MTDYSKLKVTDLKELLSQRELPTTGKKDELIARLTADDKAKASNGAKTAEPIQETPAAPVSAPVIPPTSNQQAEKEPSSTETNVPNPPTSEATSTSPATGEKKKFTFKRLADEFDTPASKEPEEAKPAEPTKPAEPAESFAAGLASTNADSELEKRKKRAARFGIPVGDSVKLQERAKRFAADEGDDASKNKAIKALDSALGENRGKKRIPETQIQNDPPKKSKDGSKPSAPAKGILSDPGEKAKAEARAKRFG
ncbi:hypothetical protein AA313_de0207106 [Arthrobotrys entomopaga]|nr:hypothetical protein AA313_de0207106 [Arthrobotrys entomopaga]